ncbi:MAG TPA: hypothetical protein VFV10_11190 [Gammaproteobacteria bacterium]|nr:hypothetical protein [Gammaproteobacteria bacterium]
MAEPLHCYRCGGSLERLTLPLSRLDECPSCGVQLHVCRMCVHYAPSKPKQCDEDDALEVRDKRTPNFCDYFTPSAQAFSGGEAAADRDARERLAALFGDAAASAAAKDAPKKKPSPEDIARQQAEALFKK